MTVQRIKPVWVSLKPINYRISDTKNKSKILYRLIKSRAEEFGIDPEMVGCIGASSGGNLCARLASSTQAPVYDVRTPPSPPLCGFWCL